MVIFIPILFLGFYTYFQSKSLLKEQAMYNLEEHAATMAMSLSSKIDRYNTIVNYIIFNTGIQRIVHTEYTDLVILSNDLRNYLDPHFTMVKNFNNEIKQLTLFLEHKPDFGDYIQSYEQMNKSNWYQGEVMADLETSGWYFNRGELFVTRKFPDLNLGRNKSMLFMSLNRSLFFQELSSSATENNGMIIVNDENQIIYQKDSPSMKNGNKLLETLEINKNEIVTFDHVDYMVITNQIRGAEWTLYYYVPVSSISVNASHILYATLIVVIVCLCILLFISLLFSMTLIKPIKYLYNQMKLVEEGTFNINVSSQNKDEIGVLTNGFGKMVKKINQLIKEVYENKIIQKEAELKALQSQLNPHFYIIYYQ